MRENKYNLLGININATNYSNAVTSIIDAAQNSQPYSVSALAVHGVMTGVLDDQHRYRLNQLDLVVPDGQPVKWGVNWLYKTKMRDRVYGPTLTLEVCKAAARNKISVYLYGSTHDVLTSLEQNLLKLFPELTIAGKSASKFRTLSEEENTEMTEKIKRSGAKITLAGLGCPRQEVWAYENVDALSMPVLAVGAAFDFHAGLLPQAPKRMQDLGLEWLYRLYREPKRLWRRYLYLNPLYMYYFFLQFFKIKEFQLSSSKEPLEIIRYG